MKKLTDRYCKALADRYYRVLGMTMIFLFLLGSVEDYSNMPLIGFLVFSVIASAIYLKFLSVMLHRHEHYLEQSAKKRQARNHSEVA